MRFVYGKKKIVLISYILIDIILRACKCDYLLLDMDSRSYIFTLMRAHGIIFRTSN